MKILQAFAAVALTLGGLTALLQGLLVTSLAATAISGFPSPGSPVLLTLLGSAALFQLASLRPGQRRQVVSRVE